MSPPAVLGQLETERLVLRSSVVDDASVFRTMWTERDPRVPPHRQIGADGHPTTEDIAGWIRARVGESGPRLLTVVVKDSTGVIGYCGLTTDGDGSVAEPELAYELLRSAQGRGYATEAAGAVVGWAERSGYRRLRAGVRDWNEASRRVLAKLGFRETGPAGPVSEHGHSLLTVRELSSTDESTHC